MADSEIQKLIERIKQGDRSARRELLEILGDKGRLHCAILTMVRKLMPRHHPARGLVESQDLVQSAFGAVLKGLPDFKGGTERQFFGWLRAIIHSKIERARRAVEREKRPGREPAVSRDPIEEVVNRDLIEALWGAIRKLPLDQQLVIDLRIRGNNSSQAAEILSLTAAAVRKREERAVENLRALMKV